MNPIADGWLELAFRSVVHATWQGTVLALIVWGLTRCLRERVRANWRFALWLVVFARLGLPWVPAAPWSVFCVLPNFGTGYSEDAEVAVGDVPVTPDAPLAPGRLTLDSPGETGRELPTGPQIVATRDAAAGSSRSKAGNAWGARILISEWLAIGWLVGVALLAARIAWRHLRLVRWRTLWQAPTDPAISALFELCRAEARVFLPVELQITSQDIGPATCGVLVPTIVLPQRLVTSLSRDELRLVFLHELIHVRRRDAAVDLLTRGFACLHWFSPAAWLALASLRRERELACDAAVLDLLGANARKDYGSVLLKTVETLQARPRLAGAVAMFDNRFYSDSLTGRIHMIANYRRMTGSAHCVGGMLFLLLALFGLTGASGADGKTQRVYSVSRDNSGLIGAPVMYGNTMLIVVTDQGVAAIVFREKDPQLVNASAKYRFRYLKDAQSEEVAGAGIVLDSVNNIEECTIKAGPIRVGFSGSGHDRGWIYYQPEEMHVCIATADRFEDSVIKDVDKEFPVQKLDLKRFLKKQK